MRWWERQTQTADCCTQSNRLTPNSCWFLAQEKKAGKWQITISVTQTCQSLRGSLLLPSQICIRAVAKTSTDMGLRLFSSAKIGRITLWWTKWVLVFQPNVLLEHVYGVAPEKSLNRPLGKPKHSSKGLAGTGGRRIHLICTGRMNREKEFGSKTGARLACGRQSANRVVGGKPGNPKPPYGWISHLDRRQVVKNHNYVFQLEGRDRRTCFEKNRGDSC